MAIRGTVNGTGKEGASWEIIVRGQSYFSRLPKYWPPIPLSARRVCTPRLCCGGRTDSAGGGDGGSIFWKTREIGLPSYNDLSSGVMNGLNRQVLALPRIPANFFNVFIRTVRCKELESGLFHLWIFLYSIAGLPSKTSIFLLWFS